MVYVVRHQRRAALLRTEAAALLFHMYRTETRAGIIVTATKGLDNGAAGQAYSTRATAFPRCRSARPSTNLTIKGTVHARVSRILNLHIHGKHDNIPYSVGASKRTEEGGNEWTGKTRPSRRAVHLSTYRTSTVKAAVGPRTRGPHARIISGISACVPSHNCLCLEHWITEDRQASTFLFPALFNSFELPDLYLARSTVNINPHTFAH